MHTNEMADFSIATHSPINVNRRLICGGKKALHLNKHANKNVHLSAAADITVRTSVRLCEPGLHYAVDFPGGGWQR